MSEQLSKNSNQTRYQNKKDELSELLKKVIIKKGFL